MVTPPRPAPGPDPDEAALLARLRQGDPQAFEELVRDHAGRMLEVTRRFLRNDDDAQDALQDAFLSAWKGLATFHAGSRLSTWLHRIAVNAALMKLRARKSRPQDSCAELLPAFDDEGHHADPPGRWDERADEPLLRAETRALVRAAIDSLPDTYRTVLLLRDIEEISTEEAAAVLGVTANAVKIRLHRARQALRTLLDPSFHALAP